MDEPFPPIPKSKQAAWLAYPPRGVISAAAIDSFDSEGAILSTQAAPNTDRQTPGAQADYRPDEHTFELRPWSRASPEVVAVQTKSHPKGRGPELSYATTAAVDGDLVLALEPSNSKAQSKWD